MILSAGFGTRMKEYTKYIPKPLLPIANYPLIAYSLFLLYVFKVEKVIINLHYKGEQIKDFLKNFPYFEIMFSEEKEILGTAGGIAFAIYQNLLESYFIIINPDTILFPEFNPYDDISVIQETIVDHLLYIKKKEKRHIKEKGFIIDSNLKGINTIKLKEPQQQESKSSNNTEEFFYIGFSVFHESFFSYYKEKTFENQQNDIQSTFKKELSELLYEKKLYGKIYQGIHIDCGTKEDYEELIHKYSSPYEIIPENLHQKWNTFIKGWLK